MSDSKFHEELLEEVKTLRKAVERQEEQAARAAIPKSYKDCSMCGEYLCAEHQSRVFKNGWDSIR